MLPPLTDKGSMLTSVKHEQKNVDVPTASNFSASFNFKHQANLDADSLSPYFASLNQVPLYILIVIKQIQITVLCFLLFIMGMSIFFLKLLMLGVIASIIRPMLVVAYS